MYYKFVFVLKKYNLILLTKNLKKSNIIIIINIANKIVKPKTDIRIQKLQIDNKL